MPNNKHRFLFLLLCILLASYFTEAFYSLEIFSFLGSSKNFRLFDILVNKVYQDYDFQGLIIFKLIAASCIVISYYCLVSSITKELLVSFLITVLAASPVLYEIEFSPFMLALVLYIPVIRLVFSIEYGNISKFNVCLGWLCLLILSCFHISWIFIALLCIYKFIKLKKFSNLFLVLTIFLASNFLFVNFLQAVPRISNLVKYNFILNVDPPTVYYYPLGFLLILIGAIFLVFSKTKESFFNKEEIVIISLLTLFAISSKHVLPFSSLFLGVYSSLQVKRLIDFLDIKIILTDYKFFNFLLKPGAFFLLFSIGFVFISKLYNSPSYIIYLPYEYSEYLIGLKNNGNYSVYTSARTGDYLSYLLHRNNITNIDPILTSKVKLEDPYLAFRLSGYENKSLFPVKNELNKIAPNLVLCMKVLIDKANLSKH